jgi:hypothetical protein
MAYQQWRCQLAVAAGESENDAINRNGGGVSSLPAIEANAEISNGEAAKRS